LGSTQPWKSDPEVYRHAFELEGPRRDLASIGLTTPEAVLARQLASQRTAFAVARPGPVQLDDFPILEYEAPRAFYMYLESRGIQRLQSYDERTWQMGLAPLEKNRALAELNLASLSAVFVNPAGTGNPELQAYLGNRFQGRAGSMVFGNKVMPCIFEGTNSGAVLIAPASMLTNAVSRQLYGAEAMLRTDATKRSQAVESIKAVLSSLQAYRRQDVDWSAAYYADLAVKASLRLGNAAQAKAILLRGLQLERDSEQLRYLSRILIREGILQPGEFNSVIGR
jgi:hypothetical protein